MFYLVIKLTKLLALPRHVRNKKLTEVSVSYFFRANDYTVVMETLGMKYGTKKLQRRAKEIVNHMVLKELSLSLT